MAQILAYPIGVSMAKIPYPSHWPLAWFFNPGPFNIKEHCMITIMATVSSGTAYTTDIFITQHAWYRQALSPGYMILLTLATQMIGFSYAGFCRQILVWPAAMIWPSNLQTTALMNAMHDGSHHKFRGWTRNGVFCLATAATFVWEWVPTYLFTGLSVFSWPTWIAPKNKGVNVVFGGSGGIGLNFISFDWNQIGVQLGSPLYVPWFALVNTFLAFLIVQGFVAPLLWATNVKNTGYLTFSSSGTYDRFGNSFSTDYVVNKETMELDIEKYNQYSRQYLPATFLLSYALGFAAITACLSHVILFYGKDIMQQFRRALSDEPDIHARLMSRYREVPHWWYATLFLISFALAIPSIKVYHTEMPVWMFIIALLIPAVYMIPVGVVQAVTSIQIGLNVITELICGYALPGRPIAMMIFKTFGYITMYQGLSFVSDLKFGHYMKIPPRDMFWAQTTMTIWSSLVQVAVTVFLFGNVTNICKMNPHEPINPPRYTCLAQHTFYSASVIFGLVGPGRNFAAGEQYAYVNIMFLVGAVVPIPTWFLAKRFPNSWFRLVNWPLIFTSTAMMPPATGINFSSWFLTGWFFQYFLRRNYFEFWAHSNYILSAAFSAGSAVAAIIITACLELPTSNNLQNNVFNGDNMWWGNNIETNTLQGSNMLLMKQPPANGFAPAPDGNWYPNPIQS